LEGNDKALSFFRAQKKEILKKYLASKIASMEVRMMPIGILIGILRRKSISFPNTLYDLARINLPVSVTIFLCLSEYFNAVSLNFSFLKRTAMEKQREERMIHSKENVSTFPSEMSCWSSISKLSNPKITPIPATMPSSIHPIAVAIIAVIKHRIYMSSSNTFVGMGRLAKIALKLTLLSWHTLFHASLRKNSERFFIRERYFGIFSKDVLALKF